MGQVRPGETRCQASPSHRSGARSVVFLKFNFDRAIGFYVLQVASHRVPKLLQVYMPLVIIVMSSWVSFWLIKTEMGQETPARTGLGSTTVLAVVTVGFGFVGRTKPPTSGWITAMDLYILFCFIMVFLAFVEFAFISFIGIFIKRMKITDMVRVTTLRQMTRCAASPLVDMPPLLDSYSPDLWTSTDSAPLMADPGEVIWWQLFCCTSCLALLEFGSHTTYFYIQGRSLL